MHNKLQQFHFSIAILLLALVACTEPNFDEAIISDKTLQLVDQIAEVNVVMGDAVGSGGTRPQQYDNFEALKSQASFQELLELTDHPNGVVRCYAFWALTLRDSTDLLSIVIDHIDDSTKVETQFGCSVYDESVGDFFIDLVTPPHYENSRVLSTSQLAKLDRALLVEPNFLEATNSAIFRAELTEENHSIFRRLVEENNGRALLKLATYHDPADIDLIMQYRDESVLNETIGFHYNYKAIIEFPHPRFLPFLKKNLVNTLDENYYKHEWNMLYQAIAIYKNESAVSLLKIPLTKVKNKAVRDYHLDFVLDAITVNLDPIYDDLLWLFWEEEQRLTPAIEEYLRAIDYGRAERMAAKINEEQIPSGIHF